MRNDNLKSRTKAFALETIRLVESLPRSRTAEVVTRQLLRSATSVAANYRAACRARSRKDFISKMGIVEEEADESGFWFELIADCRLAALDRVEPLQREASQLVAITIASIRTARGARTSIPQSAIRTPHSARSALRIPHSA
jgi:four helix bundle protein